jgi:hypothetical protein
VIRRRYQASPFVKLRYLHKYVLVRAARPVFAALAGVAVIVLAAPPALAANGVRLALSDSHGAAGEPVTATVSYSASWGWLGASCDGPVTFRWDGRGIAQVRPGRSGGSCSAAVTLTPPTNASGPHVIGGSVPNVGSAEATYTIESPPAAPRSAPESPAAAPSPTATPAPGPATSAAQGEPAAGATRSGRPSSPSQPARAAGSPSRSAVAIAGLSGRETVGERAAPAALDAPTVVVRPAVTTPLEVWVLLAGTALVLLGSALVGATRVYRKRKRVAFSI